jgi:hypothetical protein
VGVAADGERGEEDRQHVPVLHRRDPDQFP